MTLSVRRLRQRVAGQACYQCGYCLTQEVVSGIPLTLEHIIPKAKGGLDTEENLWLSCRLCNETKGVLTEVADPGTGISVPLFNPRTQCWKEHFNWSEDGTCIIGRHQQAELQLSHYLLTASFGFVLEPFGLRWAGIRRNSREFISVAFQWRQNAF